MIIFAFASMLIALLAVVFALQNTTETSVGFLVWSFKGSQALILLAALFAGVAVSFLAYLPSLVKYRWTIRSLRKKISAVEELLAEHNPTLVETPAEPAPPRHRFAPSRHTPHTAEPLSLAKPHDETPSARSHSPAHSSDVTTHAKPAGAEAIEPADSSDTPKS